MNATVDFAALTPILPFVPAAQRSEFFETAPGGTVVEVDGNLYQKARFGDRWLGLNDVVLDYTFGSPAAVYEDWRWETVAEIAVSQKAEVFVVRIGGSRV